MPVMTGVELIKAIRDMESCDNLTPTPVFAFTSALTTEVADSIEKSGGDHAFHRVNFHPTTSFFFN